MLLNMRFYVALGFTDVEAVAIFMFARDLVYGTGGLAWFVASISAFPIDFEFIRAVARAFAQVWVDHTPKQFAFEVPYL